MVETLRHVPAPRLPVVMQDYRDDGATRVWSEDEGGGLFTVFADYQSAGRVTPPTDPAVVTPPTDPVVMPSPGAVPAVIARDLAIDVLARTIWGEARGEPREGREAVAAVILNRLKRGPATRFGATVEACCRMPLHFSCWNLDDPNLPKLLAVTAADDDFRECLEIAEAAVDGRLADRTRGCDHYHTAAVSPPWSRGKRPKVVIGSHLFFDDIA